MDKVKGKLMIQNEIYKKKVSPPTIREMVDLSPERVKSIMSMEVHQGATLAKNGSSFIGLTAAVCDYKTIRDLYIKLKLTYPSARHIVCAYWIPGAKTHYTMDFHDNGDHGASRAILELLKQNDVGCRVVFVVRFCTEEKLGPNRIHMYQKAASSAINLNGMNDILDTRQSVKTDNNHVPILEPVKWPKFKTQEDRNVKDEDTARLDAWQTRKKDTMQHTMTQQKQIYFNFATPMDMQ